MMVAGKFGDHGRSVSDASFLVGTALDDETNAAAACALKIRAVVGRASQIDRDISSTG